MYIDLFLMYVLTIFLMTAAFACAFQVIGFGLSLKLKRNDIADVMWGLGFVFVAFAWFFFMPLPLAFSAKLGLLLISLWGFRLTSHILERFLQHAKEDRRYKAWRDSWTYVKTRSFFQVFILQGLFMSVILLPFALHINSGIATHPLFIIIGLVMWLVGFYFQVLGDYQLKNFLKNRANKGKMMREGVWSLTRHPNYFGEMTMWWGIFFISLSVLHPVYVLASLIGPLSITLLLRYVSGVPMLEKHWEEKYKKEFKQYKKETPMLVPDFKKMFSK